MNRSIALLLATITCVTMTGRAHADLDALLSDWTNEASAEAALSEPTNRMSGDSLTTHESAALLNMTSEQGEPAKQGESAKQGEQAETLAGHHNPVIEPVPMSAAQFGSSAIHTGYQAPVTINPHVQMGSSCGCDRCDANAPVSCQSCPSSVGGCSSCGDGCSGQCGALVPRCIEGKSECRPHRRPVLPPPSTMLQYFNSRNSYSAVWAGYADETRLRIRNKSPHLDGTWRCRGCGELLEPGDVCCDGGCSN